jgi:hypothetical protein
MKLKYTKLKQTISISFFTSASALGSVGASNGEGLGVPLGRLGDFLEAEGEAEEEGEREGEGEVEGEVEREEEVDSNGRGKSRSISRNHSFLKFFEKRMAEYNLSMSCGG